MKNSKRNMNFNLNVGRPARVVISVLVILAIYYFELPPLNLRSKLFWSFLTECIVIFIVVCFLDVLLAIIRNLLTGNARSFNDVKDLIPKITPKGFLAVALAFVFILALQFVGDVIGHPFFHSSAYSKLVTVEEGDFAQDVAELSMSQIPVVDKASAQRLGNRKLGEISDLVSQFEIMDKYTQVNYQGTPYRVTPLQYGDPIKWFMNQKEGLPAYIEVNMVTQETTLKRLDSGMKYSTSEYFFRNINRFLRVCYPTKIFDFDDISFEIDEEGTPYWVAPVITYRIGIWSGKDVCGAVLVNSITGEHKYYSLEDIPSWVDQVFISDLIVSQLDYYGEYQNGFINSMFGQKGVKETTDGYNYIAIGDDVYLYTGMTSVTSDDSNTGFMLVNLRTKEAKYYTVPGATEYSAMESAQGQVQQMQYEATFPILLNISDRPTYFMSLKDDAGLVKMYAFVDVEQYQIVGTGTSVKSAMQNYAESLGDEDISGGSSESGTEEETEAATENTTEEALTPEAEITGQVTDVSAVVVNGNTIYYILLKDDDNVYTADVSVNAKLPFLKAGDTVEISYATKGDVRKACTLSINPQGV